MLNVALIGYGLSGKYLIAPFLQANPNFRIKTVVRSRAGEPADVPGARTTAQVEDAFEDPSIDVIVVSSPNDTHYDLATRSLAAGKHTVVEKPMTAMAEQAEALIELARRQGKILTVYQNRRFDGGAQTVRKIVEREWLGTLLAYEAHYDRWVPNPNPKKWKETAGPATGLLYDLGAHLIDEALQLFGQPDRFEGRVWKQRPGSPVDDAFEVRLNFGTMQATLKGSLLVREIGPRYILYGDRGSFIKHGHDTQEEQLKAGALPGSKGFGLDLPDNYGLLNTTIDGLPVRGRVETIPGDYGPFFQNLYEAIVEGKPLLVTPESVVPQISIMEWVKKNSGAL